MKTPKVTSYPPWASWETKTMKDPFNFVSTLVVYLRDILHNFRIISVQYQHNSQHSQVDPLVRIKLKLTRTQKLSKLIKPYIRRVSFVVSWPAKSVGKSKWSIRVGKLFTELFLKSTFPFITHPIQQPSENFQIKLKQLSIVCVCPLFYHFGTEIADSSILPANKKLRNVNE